MAGRVPAARKLFRPDRLELWLQNAQDRVCFLLRTNDVEGRPGTLPLYFEHARHPEDLRRRGDDYPREVRVREDRFRSCEFANRIVGNFE